MSRTSWRALKLCCFHFLLQITFFFFLLSLIILYFLLPLVIYLMFFFLLSVVSSCFVLPPSLPPALFDTLIASQINSGGLWKDVNYFNWWFIPHKINQFLLLSCQSIEVCRAFQSLSFLRTPFHWLVSSPGRIVAWAGRARGGLTNIRHTPGKEKKSFY